MKWHTYFLFKRKNYLSQKKIACVKFDAENKKQLFIDDSFCSNYAIYILSD